MKVACILAVASGGLYSRPADASNLSLGLARTRLRAFPNNDRLCRSVPTLASGSVCEAHWPLAEA
jgi:hypothetical protein